MDKAGWEDFYSWPYGGHDDYLIHFAIVMDGENFKIHPLKYAVTGGNNGHRFPNQDALSIGEQLDELSIKPNFIVEVSRKDTNDNGEGDLEIYWTIYKMDRFDQITYLQSEVDKAAAELKAEIAAAFA